MALKETWRPRIDWVDDADSSAVNEIAAAVIELEKNSNEAEETAKRAEITADEAKEAVESLNVGLIVVDGKINITFKENI